MLLAVAAPTTWVNCPPTYSSGAATSAGFVPAGDHSAVLLQGDPGRAAAVGVTLEPTGGSAQPTTTPVLAVQV